MKTYHVEIAEQAHTSLRTITLHKIEHSGNESSAMRFVDGFYTETEKLATFPYRGINMSDNYKALIYKDHLIIYTIQEPNQVFVLDIIDPQQDTIASQYY